MQICRAERIEGHETIFIFSYLPSSRVEIDDRSVLRNENDEMIVDIIRFYVTSHTHRSSIQFTRKMRKNRVFGKREYSNLSRRMDVVFLQNRKKSKERRRYSFSHTNSVSER